MMLCLDAGNSRLKYGLRDATLGPAQDWLTQGALDYAALQSLPGLLPAAPRRVVACNVAGAGVAQQLEALAAVWNVKIEWFRSAAAACGVTNGYAQPEQLGADRWAALIGASGLHDGPAVVVLAGTATTIDAMDAGGVFRGGLILPGLRMMRTALARDTADLPEARGHYTALPTSTDDAIVSGAIHATLGAIERVRLTLAADALTVPGVNVILSGGAAGDLVSHIPIPCHSVQNLVLEGLARFAQY